MMQPRFLQNKTKISDVLLGCDHYNTAPDVMIQFFSCIILHIIEKTAAPKSKDAADNVCIFLRCQPQLYLRPAVIIAI